VSFPASPEPYILVTDQDLNYVGDPVSQIQSLEVTQNYNTPDSGSFTVPAHPEYMSALLRGNRVVIIREGEIFSAGPMERPGGYEWDITNQAEPGTITVDFTDDSVHPASRRVYPDPAAQAHLQTKQYYEASGNAETIMRDLVNLNAGPGALTPRRTPSLVLGAVAGAPGTAVVQTRFEPLSDVLRSVAIAGGGLGFEVRQVDNQLVFRVFEPEDKTKTARFSRGLGNLRSVKYDVSAPTGTVSIVLGSERSVNVNPYFESDITGWGGIFATVSHETSVVRPGHLGSLKVTPLGGNAVVWGGSSASGVGTVVGGQNYTAEMWVYSSTSGNFRITINWLNAAGAQLSASDLTAQAVPAGVWTKLTLSAPAHASASRASVNGGREGTPSSSAVYYLSDVRLSPENESDPPVSLQTVVVRNNSIGEGNWWRTEITTEGSAQQGEGSDPLVVMHQAGDEALATNGEEVSLTTVTVDTEDVKYGRDFRLGDIVTVEVMPGIEVTDTVRSAHYKYDPEEGESVSVLVGSQEATRDPVWIQVIQEMSARLGRLERK
jgi:Siphovirus ReqiPepy6 Gp37-like protein